MGPKNGFQGLVTRMGPNGGSKGRLSKFNPEIGYKSSVPNYGSQIGSSLKPICTFGLELNCFVAKFSRF